ncbi:hypothetical protein FE257_000234 [Aspergillus nanangensis]|uniref:Zn(2)-C6 fungal-type domain-containing protein n=1 Tax=Aspergillus nanangensis TaxID=2582783 RepID=A0AAD4H019_ASPNN|nr:hypothetical protein FE257_000234 [Aspergillus nanangensis]
MSEPNRPLAPAPPGLNTSNDPHQRRKNVGTACLACKARKLKCTGAAPCANCIKSRLECTLDQAADRRRRGALKRKIDQLEEKEDLLVRLVGVLRDTGSSRTVPLLNLIRSNATLAEIRYYLDHQLPRSEFAKSSELADVCHAMQRVQRQQEQEQSPSSMRRILDAKRLSDIPRFRVPARPWTNVTEDNDFVSHLVSLWFTWSHPFANWIDRDRFIRDMQVGGLRAQFCSPFLVNILLAEACAYSDYPEAYAVAGDVSSKGAHFYTEAKRLLDKEEGRISLATVQGIGLLWACQLAYAAQELALKHSVLASKADEDTLSMARVINNASWGLFNIATVQSLSEKKPPLIKPPQRPSLPLMNHDSQQDEWEPYPTQGSHVRSHTNCVLIALSSLNLITYDLAQYFFQADVRRPRSDIELKTTHFHTRLIHWLDRLPPCLKADGLEVPHILSLHMYYHTITLTIFGFLKTPPMRHHPNDPPSSSYPSIPPSRAHSICRSSARAIAHLIRRHQQAWGVDRMPVRNVQWITAALFTLLDGLDDSDNREAFIGLTVSAKAFSRRWGSSKGLLRTVEAVAQKTETGLPTETDPLFAELDTKTLLMRGQLSGDDALVEAAINL